MLGTQHPKTERSDVRAFDGLMDKAKVLQPPIVTRATEVRYLYFNILTVKKVSGLSVSSVLEVAIEERVARHKVPIGTRTEVSLEPMIDNTTAFDRGEPYHPYAPSRYNQGCYAC